MFDVELNDSAILLTFPDQEKERAKRIPGRTWDPAQKCWLYPRNRRTLDAIIAEFGSSLRSATIRLPSVERPAAPAPQLSGVPELTALHDKLAEMAARLDQSHNDVAARTEAEIAVLRSDLRQREAELMAARAAAERREAELQGQIATLQEEVASVRQHNRTLAADLSVAKKASEPQAWVSARLHEAGNYNQRLLSDMVDLSFRSDMAQTMRTRLERLLRESLGPPDATVGRTNLAEMISEARARGLLSEDGCYSAHQIRTHGNHVTHAEAPQRTHWAKSLIALASAALVWPELAPDQPPTTASAKTKRTRVAVG